MDLTFSRADYAPARPLVTEQPARHKSQLFTEIARAKKRVRESRATQARVQDFLAKAGDCQSAPVGWAREAIAQRSRILRHEIEVLTALLDLDFDYATSSSNVEAVDWDSYPNMDMPVWHESDDDEVAL